LTDKLLFALIIAEASRCTGGVIHKQAAILGEFNLYHIQGISGIT